LTYFPKIDSLRFFAALMVLVSHWLFFLPPIRTLNPGEMGVDLFFTISGFLITLQLLDLKRKMKEKNLSEGIILREFFIRRILRIFPLYYLIVIVSTLANKGEIREATAYNLTFTTNFYILKVEHWPAIFSHFWSLAVEEHFYLFWPFLVLFINNKWQPLTILFIVAGTFIAKYYAVSHGEAYFFLHVHSVSCLDLLMYGCFLAWLYRFKYYKLKEVFEFSGFLLLSITLIIAIIVYRYYFMQTLDDYILLRSLTAIAFSFLVGALVFSNVSERPGLLNNKWLVLGGKLSYGIYLIHNFVPGLLLGIKGLDLHWSLEFLIYFLFTLVVSFILHKLVELPVKKWGKQKFTSASLKD
jgi:peptidoglycan/LPS O-acetylase OafA/YrhL